MSGYILCQVKKAVQPFYLESINRNLYSYEELCYFLTHNLYLIDEQIFNEKLCGWLMEELDLIKLARRIKMLIQEQASLEELIIPIVKEHNYLSLGEYRILNQQLVKYDGQSSLMKEKLRSDALVFHGKYVDAIKLYHKTLSDPKKDSLGSTFVGSIYHNLGCAYIRLFQQEEAMSCFYKAYEQLHSHDSLKSYLIAYYMCRNEEEYESKIKELGVDSHMKDSLKKEIFGALSNSKDKGTGLIYKKACDDKHKGDLNGYETTMDGLLIKLTREYHRNTGL